MKIHKQFFKLLLLAVLFIFNVLVRFLKFSINIFKSRETKEREELAILLKAEKKRLEITNKRYLEKFSGKRRYTPAPKQ
jgi:hypothetical protein